MELWKERHGCGGTLLGCARSEVAVKVMRRQGATEAALRREANAALALGRLQLPHVVRVHGYCEEEAEAPRPASRGMPAEGPVLAIVLEHCSMGSLAALMSRLAKR